MTDVIDKMMMLGEDDLGGGGSEWVSEQSIRL